MNSKGIVSEFAKKKKNSKWIREEEREFEIESRKRKWIRSEFAKKRGNLKWNGEKDSEIKLNSRQDKEFEVNSRRRE